MRDNESITGKAYNKIETYKVGETFTVSDIYNSGDLSCNSRYGERQRLYDILCALNGTGLINRVKRGTYMLMYPLPKGITSSDVDMFRGYKTTGKYDENGRYQHEVDRKENPIDIPEYKRLMDLEKSDLKTIYSVNPKTGEITPVQVMSFDQSHKAMPFTFDDIDAAEAFTEGLVRIDTEDDGLDNALSEIENDIAETLFTESSPASDPEYVKPDITEEQFKEETNANYTLEMLIKQNEKRNAEEQTPSNTQFVPVLIPVGSIIYVVTMDCEDSVKITRECVEVVQVYVRKSGVTYVVECESGYSFTKKDLGVNVFTDKNEALKELKQKV